jgi:hypothetical protein
MLGASWALAISVLFPQMHGKKGICSTPIRRAIAWKFSVRTIFLTNDASGIIAE